MWLKVAWRVAFSLSMLTSILLRSVVMLRIFACVLCVPCFIMWTDWTMGGGATGNLAGQSCERCSNGATAHGFACLYVSPTLGPLTPLRQWRCSTERPSLPGRRHLHPTSHRRALSTRPSSYNAPPPPHHSTLHAPRIAPLSSRQSPTSGQRSHLQQAPQKATVGPSNCPSKNAHSNLFCQSSRRPAA